MKTQFWALIGVIVLALVAGAAVLHRGSTTSGELRIGVVMGLTGAESTWAEHNLNAVRLAVDEINAQGGIQGTKLTLVVEDDRSDAKTGISAVQKLTDVDHVDVIIGDVWSYTTNPMIPVAESKKVPLISPTVMSSSVEGNSPYFFTLGHTVESVRPSLEKFFDKNPGIKTVYELCWSDDWGTAHAAMFEQVVHERGLILLGKDCTADYNIDYRTQATKIKAAHPDAVIMVSTFSERATKALNEQGYRGLSFTTSTTGNSLRTGLISASQLGSVSFSDWIPSNTFVDAYMKRFGDYPVTEAQNGYEVVRTIARAYEANPSNLLAGLATVKYEGVEGMIDFTRGSRITANQAQTKLYRVSASGDFTEVK